MRHHCGQTLSPATSSSEIHLLQLSKRFRTGRRGLVAALDDANLWIRRGETLSVVGPTGCGKSTLLRVIAGLEQPDSGSVTFDGEGVDELSPSQRGIGLVFQSYASTPISKCMATLPFTFAYVAGQPQTSTTKCRKPLASWALASTSSWGGCRARSLGRKTARGAGALPEPQPAGAAAG